MQYLTTISRAIGLIGYTGFAGLAGLDLGIVAGIVLAIIAGSAGVLMAQFVDSFETD